MVTPKSCDGLTLLKMTIAWDELGHGPTVCCSDQAAGWTSTPSSAWERSSAVMDRPQPPPPFDVRDLVVYKYPEEKGANLNSFRVLVCVSLHFPQTKWLLQWLLGIVGPLVMTRITWVAPGVQWSAGHRSEGVSGARAALRCLARDSW